MADIASSRFDVIHPTGPSPAGTCRKSTVTGFAVGRSGKVAVVGSAHASTFTEVPGYWPKKGYITDVTRTRLFERSSGQWITRAEAEVGSYDVWSSSMGNIYNTGLRLGTVARSLDAAWLVYVKQYEVKAVGAGCPISDPCAYVPWETGTLRHVDEQGMTTFCEASVTPGALASLSSNAVLVQATGDCYELVRGSSVHPQVRVKMVS